MQIKLGLSCWWYLIGSLLTYICHAEDCTIGWTKHQKKCYRAISDSYRYGDCEVGCGALLFNATMLCIENIEQVNFIHSQVAWESHIGLQRSNGSNEFSWLIGCNSSFTRWETGQPHSRSDDVAYVGMKGDTATWFDYTEGNSSCACEYTLINPADDDYDYGGYSGSTGDDDYENDSVATTIILVFTGFFGSLCMLCGPGFLMARLRKAREGEFMPWQTLIMLFLNVLIFLSYDALAAQQTENRVVPGAPALGNEYMPVPVGKTAVHPPMNPVPTAPYQYARGRKAVAVYAAPHVEMVPLGATAGAGAGAGGQEAYVVVEATAVVEKAAGAAENV
jgi:hypothetical protein